MKKKPSTPEAPPPPFVSDPDPAESTQDSAEPEPTAGFWAQRFEKIAKLRGPALLQKFRQRERRNFGFRAVPDQMHRLARQLSLSIEMVDDFRSGEYRDIPWRAVVIIAGAILYTVSPADVIPDALIGIGALDDAVVLVIATRLIRRHLHDYCRFKGYDPADYFGPLPFKEKHRAPSIEPKIRVSEPAYSTTN